MLWAPNDTENLSKQVVEIPKPKLRPRDLGPYRVTKITNTTAEIDLPGGGENISINRLVCVPGIQKSLPSLQKGPPSTFGVKDESVGTKPSLTHTVYRMRYDDNRSLAWIRLENIPADVVVKYHESTGISFPKVCFKR